MQSEEKAKKKRGFPLFMHNYLPNLLISLDMASSIVT